MVESIKTWSGNKSKSVLEGPSTVIKDKQPQVSHGKKPAKSTYIIYVNFSKDGLSGEFLAFIQKKAVENASGMFCIQQNNAKKSDTVIYPVLIRCDNNAELGLENVEKAF